jgi:hypothetical protein
MKITKILLFTLPGFHFPPAINILNNTTEVI